MQRDCPVPVWGWADAGEAVTVELAGQELKTTAEADGHWLVRFAPLATGDNLSLVVRGTNTITLTDLLLGDVWVCSGQSNMTMRVKDAAHAEEEIAAAVFPEMRIATVANVSKLREESDASMTAWTPVTPSTIASFSATAYYFGRELHKELKVPIGLIHTSWGGASCAAWVSESALKSYAEFRPVLEQAKDEKVPPQQKACHLYNGMLHPLMPLAIRGVIWYQGEADASHASEYEKMFPVLIQNWREAWGQGDFPFYFVQLANFKARAETPGESDWAELREAQDRTLALRRTGQAVSIDIGEANDIHPKNKQEVGRRLALLALAEEYGRDVVASGPRFHSLAVRDSEVTVTFDEVADGLKVQSADETCELSGFALAGADRRFYWAKASLASSNTIVLSAPEVECPVAVRYNWSDNPGGNLYNSAGLPAVPFRSDRWPRINER
ncbi:MAG: sialate O-acetylesterase [Planctomycetia bacterium]|nr:sialate O-acetylesterase [Planctomycetia bacterium]